MKDDVLGRLKEVENIEKCSKKILGLISSAESYFLVVSTFLFP